MTEILFPNLDKDKPPPGVTAEPQTPAWGAEVEVEKKAKSADEAPEAEDVMVSSAHMEPSTLQWPGAKEGHRLRENGRAGSEGGLGRAEGKEANAERASVRSECASLRGGVSRTESEREEGGRRTAEGWMEVEKERERELEEGRRTAEGWMEVEKEREREREEVEIELEEMNSMPEEAARVFSPSVTILRTVSVPESPREGAAAWDEDTEKSPFLGPHGTPPDGYYHDWPGEVDSPNCGCGCGNRDALKVGVSVFTSALIFPFLVWGGYVFLPFDAPLLESAPLRLVYTLRCSIFAIVPIVLGVLVLGVSRIRYSSLKPLCEGEAEAKEVAVHRHYVDDSVSLFLLYFLQLAVMAAYLNQDLLKLVPLLTIIFAFGRLVYWIAAAWGSSVRGFGFGFSFLPMLAMLAANLYFIFMVDSAGNIFAQDTLSSPNQPPPHRQRFWG